MTDRRLAGQRIDAIVGFQIGIFILERSSAVAAMLSLLGISLSKDSIMNAVPGLWTDTVQPVSFS